MLLCDIVNNIDVLDNRITSQPNTNPKHSNFPSSRRKKPEA